MIKYNIAVLGDFISDVVFSSESNVTMSLAKETIRSGAPPSQLASVGVGGGVYTQNMLEVLMESSDTFTKTDSSEETGIVKYTGGKEATNVEVTITNQMNDKFISERQGSVEKMSTHVNCWIVGKRPKILSTKLSKVYRVIDKPGRINDPSESKRDQCQPPLPQPSDIPDLLMISDHDRSIRYLEDWGNESEETSHKHWLTSSGGIKRIIILGNRLPQKIIDPESHLTSPETLWDILAGSEEARKSTIIITSIDRLRQEGARISKRLSWDATLIDFMKELKKFPPLEKLSKFGHLIVRVGVVGAIHCYESGEKVKFVYDPNAEQLIYRDRELQGNAFGIRSTLPACIAYELAQKVKESKSKSGSAEEDSDVIEKAIKQSVMITQEIYDAGFGTTIDDVGNYVQQYSYRKRKMKKLCKNAMMKNQQSQSQGDDEENTDFLEEGNRCKSSVFHSVILPDRRAVIEGEKAGWSIMRDNLMGVLLRAVKKDNLIELDELRVLRLARSIVFWGVDRVVNVHEFPELSDEACLEFFNSRNQHANNSNSTKYSHQSALNEIVAQERALGEKFQKRMVGEVANQEKSLKTMLLPDSSTTNPFPYPFCMPVNFFGDFVILGKKDTEAYCSVRNLISEHLSEKYQEPLSIAVLGKKGSGKSFGIMSMGRAMFGDNIEILSCKIPLIKTKTELDLFFGKIIDALSRDKTPLVFFEDLDATFVYKEPEGLVRYFISPMKTGEYHHENGVLDLKNSILVFTWSSSENLERFTMETLISESSCDPSMMQFLSYIHGYIEVEGVNHHYIENSEGDVIEKIPFLRRALVLRNEIEKDTSLLNDNQCAQLDRNIVDAFLRVERYTHGAKSIGMVLRMFAKWNKKIEKSSMPSEQNLLLHVSHDFLDIIKQ